MGRGKATVLLILGTIGLLVTGWLIASPIKHNGYTCGSVSRTWRWPFLALLDKLSEVAREYPPEQHHPTHGARGHRP